jgi:anti-sigma factor RsiW
MTCPKVGDLLRLVGGELPLDTARAVEAHAAECATCGSALAELRGGWDAVGEWQLLEAPYALPADALDRAGEPPVRRSLGPRLIRLRPAIRAGRNRRAPCH